MQKVSESLLADILSVSKTTVGKWVLSNNIYNIASDNRSSIADVIMHLKDLGHTKIAHIFGDPLNFAGLKRREHFISSMLLQDLDVRSDFLVEGTTYTTEEGYAAMKVLLHLLYYHLHFLA